MSGWIEAALDDLFDITSSKRVLQSQWSTEGVPFYRGREITKLSEYGFVENELFISEELFRAYSAKYGVPSAGDIMITAIGTIGNSYIVKATDRFYFKDASVLWLKKTSSVDSRYINWWLKSADMRSQLDKGNGATVDTLTIQKLKSLRILLPSPSEQKRIVEILDEAFDGIAKATANAQRNRASAEDLFEGFLANFFSRKEKNWKDVYLKSVCERITVGHVGSMAKRYVANGIPFLRSQNIRPFRLDLENVIYIDQKFHSELKKSSLKAGDVAIVRTGYPGTAAVIPDDLGPANCSDLVIVRPNDMVLPDFLASFFNSSFGKASVGGRLVGAAQKHFNVSAAKETILHLPPLDTQKEFTRTVEELKKEASRLEEHYLHKVAVLNEMKTALLHKAFTGQLTSSSAVPAAHKLESPMTANAKLTAQVIILAHYRHTTARRDKTFGHVKAQKILHLAESCANIPLARSPIKDAAGPNDFAHMLRAEEWAESNGFFKFNQRDSGYSFQKLKGYNQLLSDAQERLKPFKQKLDKILGLLVPMDTQEAEVFATVHAAWNNLVIDRKPITDDAIIKEARDNWHQDKLKIPKAKFLKAILLIRKEGLVPDGSAKPVRLLQEKLL